MRHWNQDQDFRSIICTFWKSNFIYIPLQRLYCLSVDNFLAKFEHWYEFKLFGKYQVNFDNTCFYYCCLFLDQIPIQTTMEDRASFSLMSLKGLGLDQKTYILPEILVNSNSSIFLSSDFWQVNSACRGNGSPELKVRHSKFCQIVDESTSLPDWTDKVLISDPLVS